MAQTSLQTQDVDSISERLKGIPLKLPRSLGEHPDTEAKALYLRNLLRRDPDVFLERYGTDLNSEERALFEPLRPDSFEVDFYMRQLEDDKSGIRALTPAVVRNRRLAKLNRLSADDFFSEVCRLMEPSAPLQSTDWTTMIVPGLGLVISHHSVWCPQAAMRKRAPDLADQYMGVSKQSELAPNSMSQGDTLDRCYTLPGGPMGVRPIRQTTAKPVGTCCKIWLSRCRCDSCA